MDVNSNVLLNASSSPQRKANAPQRTPSLQMAPHYKQVETAENRCAAKKTHGLEHRAQLIDFPEWGH